MLNIGDVQVVVDPIFKHRMLHIYVLSAFQFEHPQLEASCVIVRNAKLSAIGGLDYFESPNIVTSIYGELELGFVGV